MKLSAALYVACVVCAGCALRLAFPADIEWKQDEMWTYRAAMRISREGAYPWVGMPTSMGSVNPGLSVWAFGWLAKAFAVANPPDLARTVQWLNCAALGGFAAFIWQFVPEDRKTVWYWALALWAANPLAIIFERKIWPPSILPLLMIAVLATWWNRRSRWSCFACGAILALMSQIHLGCIFLASALLAWTCRKDRAFFAWRYWLAGVALGAVPALPWLAAIVMQERSSAWKLRPPLLHFYVRWFTQPFGLGVEYTLGRTHYHDLQSYPIWLSTHTWLVAAAHAVMAVIAVLTLILLLQRLAVDRGLFRKLLVGETQEELLVAAMFGGYGGLLTATTMLGAGSHRHYLIVIAPILALRCSRMIHLTASRWGKPFVNGVFVILCAAQLITSTSLLLYIHDTQTIKGEYGSTWNFQQVTARQDSE